MNPAGKGLERSSAPCCLLHTKARTVSIKHWVWVVCDMSPVPLLTKDGPVCPWQLAVLVV